MTISIFINNMAHEFSEEMTILDAVKRTGIDIPTLCFHSDLNNNGKCRLCSVELEGQANLVTACNTPIRAGMRIRTHSPRVVESRKMILELLLSRHYIDCISCNKTLSCELKKHAETYGIMDTHYGQRLTRQHVIERSHSIVKDNDKCILCGRCTAVCEQLQDVNAISEINRGAETYVGTEFDTPLLESVCINCGQCVVRCPTGALMEKDDTAEVWAALNDPTKHVVIQTAPAPRAAIGEEFGQAPGTAFTGQLNTALRHLGFDKVFDTNFTADLTIMEEGTELLTRLQNLLAPASGEGAAGHAAVGHAASGAGDATAHEAGAPAEGAAGHGAPVLPMITSCSPGWIKFIEHFYPAHLDHLSSCKSPQQMFGALIKTFYAARNGIDPASIVTVSLMPCTAKKFECNRDEMKSSGYQDVDYVITTRECARMIKQRGMHLPALPVSGFDDPLGLGSGAGMIFGATGGVMEAALRTVYELVTGREIPFRNLDILPVRGMEGVKEAELTIETPLPAWSFLDGVTLKVAVAHGTAQARKIMEAVQAGTAPWHFIEVMACPGGCLSGGGQPIPTNAEIRAKRAQAIYAEDEHSTIRKSHENPLIQMIYQDFLGAPGSHKAHELLHTTYNRHRG